MRARLMFAGAVLCVIATGCVESPPTPPAMNTPSNPAVYEWVGTGSQPSPLRLALHQYLCVQDADRRYPERDSGLLADDWNTHVDLCMSVIGWRASNR
jgi:hypothetical protein